MLRCPIEARDLTRYKSNHVLSVVPKSSSYFDVWCGQCLLNLKKSGRSSKLVPNDAVLGWSTCLTDPDRNVRLAKNRPRKRQLRKFHNKSHLENFDGQVNNIVVLHIGT